MVINLSLQPVVFIWNQLKYICYLNALVLWFLKIISLPCSHLWPPLPIGNSVLWKHFGLLSWLCCQGVKQVVPPVLMPPFPTACSQSWRRRKVFWKWLFLLSNSSAWGRSSRLLKTSFSRYFQSVREWLASGLREVWLTNVWCLSEIQPVHWSRESE